MRPLRPRGLVAALIAAAALCACAASGTSTSTDSGSAQSASASQAAAASSASTSLPASSAAPAVDLTLSGPLPVVAKGSAGRCQLGRDGSGTVKKFGFAATGADYPGLADGLFIDEGNGGYLTIKLLGGSAGGFLNVADIPNAVSADHKSVSIDADLGSGDVREHIAGTISCP